ncbi:hypothetical protein VP01_149g2 [Puccinia sorghi]|uniref:Uncharacterized protein n=1 Tax=Puccinia sorghi TaxID=27349 RepID=A0A0L6VJ63_9BASI|nr:hypothetical protein VP01_149g2 [Puccinia sorghi]
MSKLYFTLFHSYAPSSTKLLIIMSLIDVCPHYTLENSLPMSSGLNCFCITCILAPLSSRRLANPTFSSGLSCVSVIPALFWKRLANTIMSSSDLKECCITFIKLGGIKNMICCAKKPWHVMYSSLTELKGDHKGFILLFWVSNFDLKVSQQQDHAACQKWLKHAETFQHDTQWNQQIRRGIEDMDVVESDEGLNMLSNAGKIVKGVTGFTSLKDLRSVDINCYLRRWSRSLQLSFLRTNCSLPLPWGILNSLSFFGTEKMREDKSLTLVAAFRTPGYKKLIESNLLCEFLGLSISLNFFTCHFCSISVTDKTSSHADTNWSDTLRLPCLQARKQKQSPGLLRRFGQHLEIKTFLGSEIVPRNLEKHSLTIRISRNFKINKRSNLNTKLYTQQVDLLKITGSNKRTALLLDGLNVVEHKCWFHIPCHQSFHRLSTWKSISADAQKQLRFAFSSIPFLTWATVPLSFLLELRPLEGATKSFSSLSKGPHPSSLLDILFSIAIFILNEVLRLIPFTSQSVYVPLLVIKSFDLATSGFVVNLLLLGFFHKDYIIRLQRFSLSHLGKCPGPLFQLSPPFLLFPFQFSQSYYELFHCIARCPLRCTSQLPGLFFDSRVRECRGNVGSGEEWGCRSLGKSVGLCCKSHWMIYMEKSKVQKRWRVKQINSSLRQNIQNLFPKLVFYSYIPKFFSLNCSWAKEVVYNFELVEYLTFGIPRAQGLSISPPAPENYTICPHCEDFIWQIHTTCVLAQLSNHSFTSQPPSMYHPNLEKPLMLWDVGEKKAIAAITNKDEKKMYEKREKRETNVSEKKVVKKERSPASQEGCNIIHNKTNTSPSCAPPPCMLPWLLPSLRPLTMVNGPNPRVSTSFFTNGYVAQFQFLGFRCRANCEWLWINCKPNPLGGHKGYTSSSHKPFPIPIFLFFFLRTVLLSEAYSFFAIFSLPLNQYTNSRFGFWSPLCDQSSPSSLFPQRRSNNISLPFLFFASKSIDESYSFKSYGFSCFFWNKLLLTNSSLIVQSISHFTCSSIHPSQNTCDSTGFHTIFHTLVAIRFKLCLTNFSCLAHVKVYYNGLVWIGSINSNTFGITEHTRMFLLEKLQEWTIIMNLGNLSHKTLNVRRNSLNIQSNTFFFPICFSWSWDFLHYNCRLLSNKVKIVTWFLTLLFCLEERKCSQDSITSGFPSSHRLKTTRLLLFCSAKTSEEINQSINHTTRCNWCFEISCVSLFAVNSPLAEVNNSRIFSLPQILSATPAVCPCNPLFFKSCCYHFTNLIKRQCFSVIDGLNLLIQK